MDMSSMLKISQGWNRFTANHPKFPAFLNAVRNAGIKEGTVIAVSVTDPDGQTMETNIKVSASDIELFNSLKELR